jgi:DHA2 family multidrug resistance protein
VDLTTIMIPTLIQGVAMAFFFIPLITLALSGLTPDRIPSASGLSNFVRITAGAMGTSIFTTLWESRAAMHHSQLVEAINPGSEAANSAIAGLMAQGMSREQALGAIEQLINRQVFTQSVTELFYVSAGVFLLLIALIWLARPIKPGAGAAPAVDASSAH